MRTTRFIATMLFLASNAACNRGLSSAGSRSSGAAPQGTNVGQHLTGRAYLNAPIIHAHVTVTRLFAGREDVVGEAMTDDKGAFDLTLPQPTDGDLLIQIVGDRGGSTFEPASGMSPITLSE